jgi:hypothetical protein
MVCEREHLARAVSRGCPLTRLHRVDADDERLQFARIVTVGSVQHLESARVERRPLDLRESGALEQEAQRVEVEHVLVPPHPHVVVGEVRPCGCDVAVLAMSAELFFVPVEIAPRDAFKVGRAKAADAAGRKDPEHLANAVAGFVERKMLDHVLGANCSRNPVCEGPTLRRVHADAVCVRLDVQADPAREMEAARADIEQKPTLGLQPGKACAPAAFVAHTSASATTRRPPSRDRPQGRRHDATCERSWPDHAITLAEPPSRPASSRVFTLFTAPKPFAGRTALLQRNALASWRTLAPGVEVLVFGDELGASDAAAAAGAVHIAGLASNQNGTPRVDDLFRRAEGAATYDTLCFVNADVILPPSLSVAVGHIAAELPGAIAVGQCREVDVEEAIDGWTSWLERAALRAPLRGAGGIDYIVFPKGSFPDLPPFALGRANFDNWLVWDARRRGLPVVDLTETVPAIHQQHDYDHVDGGRAEAYFGAEAHTNYDLAGGRLRLFNIDDATHRLTADGLRRNVSAGLRAHPVVRWIALEAGSVARRLRRQGLPR